MAKAGALKEKIDRTRKKLAEGKGKLDPARVRDLKKRLRRTQRRRRSLLRAEARAKGKTAPKSAEEKKPEGAPVSG